MVLVLRHRPVGALSTRAAQNSCCRCRYRMPRITGARDIRSGHWPCAHRMQPHASARIVRVLRATLHGAHDNLHMGRQHDRCLAGQHSLGRSLVRHDRAQLDDASAASSAAEMHRADADDRRGHAACAATNLPSCASVTCARACSGSPTAAGDTKRIVWPR